MKRFVSLLIVVTLLLALTTPVFASTRQNNYTIVLVVGFGGWDRSELLGYKYFGGTADIQDNLNKNGYQTFTAGVGPLSSNWDRACELYAMIKGGVVDYGAAHAAKYGHARFGNNFGSGYYSQWDDTNKVHLVGHSMGGQTARTLTQLLEQGSAEEQAYAKSHAGTTLLPLFAGGKHWIKSITTIATPNNGTSLAIGVTKIIPYAQQLLGFAASAAGNTSEPLYSFNLDQWGLKRQQGESFSSFSDRVWNSNIWYNTHDISTWDLSPDGAKELNSWVKAQPDVYYYSWANDATWKAWFTGYQYPDVTMLPIFQPFATYMGSYTRNDSGHVVINSAWWENDGVVNTNSMAGPTVGSTDSIVNYNGTSQIGKWNYMGEKSGWDHADIIGIDLSDALGLSNINSFYSSIATTLSSLN
ncbi:MAG TPA: lipase [Desulfosporosinus sp.]|nr:lipase [Desulfosporosinus sp.]